MADRHQAQAYPLRLPEELKTRVTESARANGRSLNAEIVARLDASFDISKAGLEGPVDFSRLIAELTERQNEAALKTELALAEMRADNAEIATRGLKVEIRELREVIEEAANAGAPSHEIDELRGRLRIAEVVLPQHLDMIAKARRKADELRQQIEARAKARGPQPGEEAQQPKEPKPQTREEMRRGVEEAKAEYLALQKELDELPPLSEEEPTAEPPKPGHRLGRLAAKRSAKPK